MRTLVTLGFVAAVFAVIGYIMNIMALVTAEATTTLVEVAIRIVGIFVPFIGVLTGWLL